MSSIEHLITVADLEKYPDDDGNRYELIEGELYVSTAPGIPHQLVLVNLLTAFTSYLKTNPIGKIVPGAGAVFSNFDAVIPDVCLIPVNDSINESVSSFEKLVHNRFDVFATTIARRAT